MKSTLHIFPLLFLLSACPGGQDAEVSCPKMAQKVVEIAEKESAPMDELERKAIVAQLPTVRSAFTKQCEASRDRFTASVQTCILAAKNSAELEACNPTKAPPGR